MQVQLIIEKGENSLFGQSNSLLGRCTVEDNLIIEEAETEEQLKDRMKLLIFDFHNITDVTFETSYE